MYTVLKHLEYKLYFCNCHTCFVMCDGSLRIYKNNDLIDFIKCVFVFNHQFVIIFSSDTIRIKTAHPPCHISDYLFLLSSPSLFLILKF